MPKKKVESKINKRKVEYYNTFTILFSDDKIRDTFAKLNQTIDACGKKRLNYKSLNKLKTVYQRAFDALNEKYEADHLELDKQFNLIQDCKLFKEYRDGKKKIEDITNQKDKDFILDGIKRINEIEVQTQFFETLRNQLSWMKKVRKDLSKDITMIAYSIDNDKTPTLTEMYEQSRASHTKLNLANVDKFGGGISVRYFIEDKGYFTPTERKTDFKSKTEAFMKKLADKYPVESAALSSPTAETLLEAVFTGREFIDNFHSQRNYFLAVTRNQKNADDLKTVLINYINTNEKTDQDFKNKHIEFLNKHITNDKSARMFIEYLCGTLKLRNTRSVNRTLGINSHSKTERRNAAFYHMSELLGCQDVIARAESLHIKDIITGKVIQGTYMENVDGADINKIDDYTEKLMGLTPKALDSSFELKKSLAKIQFLDFIQGNPDRHLGNMLYQFDPFGTITGVKGIDNDTCLGKKNHIGALSGIALENLSVIPKDAFEALIGMDTNAIKTMYYGYDLTTEEIDNVLLNIKVIKEKALEDMKYFEDKPEGYIEDGRIKVVSDEELKKISIYELANNRSANEIKQGNKDKNLFASVINFANGKGPASRHEVALECAYDDVQTIWDAARELDIIHNKMVDIDRVTFNGSRRFAHAMESILAFVNYMGEVETEDKDKNKFTNAFFEESSRGVIIPDVVRITKAERLLETALDDLDTYINGKNSEKIEQKKHDSPAFVRLKLAKEARKLINKSANAAYGITDKSALQKVIRTSKNRIKKQCENELKEINALNEKKYQDMIKQIKAPEKDNNNEIKNNPVVKKSSTANSMIK